MFKLQCSKYGFLKIDFFAACLSAKPKNYVYYKPEPYSYEVDTSSICLTYIITGYIFSPFSNWMNFGNNVGSGAMLATRPWFLQFMKMIKISTTHLDMLQMPGAKDRHPLWKNLNLLTAALLLNTSQQKN